MAQPGDDRLALAGCTSAATEDTATDASAGEGFPITIEHAFGETEIEAAPERVATWGWGSTEAALALGYVSADDFDRWVRAEAMIGPRR